MFKIGVLSDTHGLLRPQAEAMLEGTDHIIHAGDIGDPGIVPRLRRIAPVTAIRGNVDTDDWAAAFPERATVDLGGRMFHVIHDLKQLALDPVSQGFSGVIAGHSHRPDVRTIDGVLQLNPGSAGRRRFKLPVTLATIHLSDDGMNVQIHAIPTA